MNTITVTVRDYFTKKEISKTTIKDPFTKKEREQMKKLMCDCDEAIFDRFADDGKCNCGIHKHHYHCVCGKVYQIG